jgi:hypothetical protein
VWAAPKRSDELEAAASQQMHGADAATRNAPGAVGGRSVVMALGSLILLTRFEG